MGEPITVQVFMVESSVLFATGLAVVIRVEMRCSCPASVGLASASVFILA